MNLMNKLGGSMEINSKVALDIFENNFDYVICETILGKAIRMNCYDAFLFVI